MANCLWGSSFTDAGRCVPGAEWPCWARPSSTISLRAAIRLGRCCASRNLPFRVVGGTVGQRGKINLGRDQDDTVLVPYTTAQKENC